MTDSDHPSPDPLAGADDVEFMRHRALVIRLGYDITGSRSDADDIAQDTWLRWRRALERGVTVDDPRSYLVRIATNLAIDVVRRRSYTGPFLPEPLASGADDELLAAEEVSLAFTLVLQSLSPLERAAFLLHEAFGYSHAEIAEMLHREQPAIRQLVSRARRHVRDARARYVVDPAEQRQLLEAFLAAALGNDLETFTAMLADDVVLTTDGGGRANAALRPIYGSDKVLRFLMGIASQLGEDDTVEVQEFNHAAAWVVWLDGAMDQVGWVQFSHGKVATISIVRNPDKLAHLTPRASG